MQRLRQRAKAKVSEETVDAIINVDMAEVEVVEVSVDDALAELKAVTSETAMNLENADRINDLLKITFEIRRKDAVSVLPPFLMAQAYLETEIELHFSSSMSDMEERLKKALMRMPSAYSVPGNILELEKLVQPTRATWSAITMGEYTPDQKRPGPSLFFGHEKLLLCAEQQLHLNNNCTLERAVILLLGVYYVLDLTFPCAYGQFLGLLQNIIVRGKKFPRSFSTQFTVDVTNKLCHM